MFYFLYVTYTFHILFNTEIVSFLKGNHFLTLEILNLLQLCIIILSVVTKVETFQFYKISILKTGLSL